MTTEFNLPNTPAPKAREMFGDWRCRVERMDDDSCNVVFFDREETDRFEQYADEHDIEYRLV